MVSLFSFMNKKNDLIIIIWFTSLIYRILWQRITIPEILEDEWFKKGYKPPVFEEKGDANLDDVEAVFKDSEVSQRYSSA